ncbi:hypothetical protein [Nitrosopumilus sp.]|uniref:hypothetical protein n=1 Tax=Nitrosopumilus sp. TaxID=2024843 RepID=UPI00292CC52D|nr:hypothetical protein [Nitrosopumilus sp.]
MSPGTKENGDWDNHPVETPKYVLGYDNVKKNELREFTILNGRELLQINPTCYWLYTKRW